ncbi:uncharacterized protein V6R79_010475 [Siganus canaliculatus]
MADNKPPSTAEATVSDVHKRVKEAFEVFIIDNISNVVPVSEIGTIICSLGCFPTEADIRDVIAEVKDDDDQEFIHLDKFLPVMTKILLDDKFPPIPEDRLLRAFEVLDKDKKGFLQVEELTALMTQGDEPFTEEEMDEMFKAHADPEKKVIYYKDVINQLTVDPEL